MQYKEQESSGSKKSADELTSDRDLVDVELSAVMEYLTNLNDMCVVNVIPCEEELRRRVTVTAELEEALYILSESELMEFNEVFTAVTEAVAFPVLIDRSWWCSCRAGSQAMMTTVVIAGHHGGGYLEVNCVNK